MEIPPEAIAQQSSAQNTSNRKTLIIISVVAGGVVFFFLICFGIFLLLPIAMVNTYQVTQEEFGVIELDEEEMVVPCIMDNGDTGRLKEGKCVEREAEYGLIKK